MGMATEPQFHVLAVDDSLLDRKLIEKLLKTSSYEVTTVDSGTKALQFLGLQGDDEQTSTPNQSFVSPNTQKQQQQQQEQEQEQEQEEEEEEEGKMSPLSPTKKDVEVNLIITDYYMPGMTGYDLLKKIKESSSLRNIPVVIMSSEYDKLRISRCLDEGAKEFFLKPVQLSDVNKLRPHMMEAKYGNQNPAEIIDLQSESQQGKQQPHRQPWQLVSSVQQSNKKRKNIDGGISPDHRTRTRYNGLTVV
ncbi:hypothetical protein Dimus_029752 [Dionaea muscipula]